MDDQPKKSVIVVGDIMVDRYTHVVSERHAPEAPIPVWDESSHDVRLGGAANVAHNLKALGGDDLDVHLAGIVATNDRDMIKRLGIFTYLCTGHETMVKHRYVRTGSDEILFRADNMKVFSKHSTDGFKLALRHFLEHNYHAVVFSDYDKGTIDQEVVDLFRNQSNFFVVDSKKEDLSIYSGMNVLKINEHEYSTQVSNGPYTVVESLFDHVVVTHGSKDSELKQYDRVKSHGGRYHVNSEKFPVDPVPAKDVTGCGDTHTAAMAFSLLKNGDVRNAVRFANACAREVVQKFGTSVVPAK